MNTLTTSDDELRLMLAMRSLIIREFDVSLSLHQHHVADFCKYGLQSTSQKLRRLTQQLAQMSDFSLPSGFSENGAPPARQNNAGEAGSRHHAVDQIYRGQVPYTGIENDLSPGNDENPVVAPKPRYYRGQIVR